MIITISGPARSGKDYIAGLLKERLNNAKLYTLSSTLKEYLCEIFSLSLEELDRFKNSTEPFTVNGTTMRTILQKFGTEIFVNKVDKLFWVNKIKEKIIADNVDYAIITDARFLHEIESFNGALKIKVIADDTIAENEHISERELDNYKFDYLIDNRNKPDLTKVIDKLVKKIKENKWLLVFFLAI